MWYKSLENVLVIVLLEYRFSLEEKSYLPTTSSVKYLTTNSLFCSNPAQSMTDSKQTAKGLIHLFPSVFREETCMAFCLSSTPQGQSLETLLLTRYSETCPLTNCKEIHL